MSYQALLSALKGGTGSGNWGHSGRPGIRGGSAAGTGGKGGGKGVSGIESEADLNTHIKNAKSNSNIVYNADIRSALGAADSGSYPGIYDLTTKTVILDTRQGKRHIDIGDNIFTHNESNADYYNRVLLDRSVHFFVEKRGNSMKLTFDADYAAGDSRKKNLNNVYRAMDKLKSTGNAGLSVVITNAAADDIDTDI